MVRVRSIPAIAAAALAIPPAVVLWWDGVRASESLGYFEGPALFAILVAMLLSAFAWREYRWGAVIAPVILLSTFALGAYATGAYGESRVLQVCRSAITEHSSSLDHNLLHAISQRTGLECRVNDVEFGGDWDVGIYTGNEEVGRVYIRREEARGLAIHESLAAH